MFPDSKEINEIISKAKTPQDLYQKITKLLDYFDEWEQNLIDKEKEIESENFRLSSKITQKEEEIRLLTIEFEKKQQLYEKKIEETKNKEIILHSNISKENSINNFEAQILKQKEEITKMWDEVLKKAESLSQKEKQINEREKNLEIKQKEYELKLQQLQNHKKEFYKTPLQDIKNFSDKTQQEIELFQKNQEFEKKQNEFYEKTKKIHDLIKMLNNNLKKKTIFDKKFTYDEQELAVLNEHLNSLETSLNKSSFLLNNLYQDDYNDEKSEEKTNIIPNFNKNIDLESKENSWEMNLSKEFQSLSRNLENEEYNYDKKSFTKRDRSNLPLQMNGGIKESIDFLLDKQKK